LSIDPPKLDAKTQFSHTFLPFAQASVLAALGWHPTLWIEVLLTAVA